MGSSLAAVFSLASLSLHILPAYSYVNYANEFIDTKVILSGNYSNTTYEAQATIFDWANELSSKGPWSVTKKPFSAPSGDKHDYMSFSPYWWPNCDNAGNTTELPPEQIWKDCQYVYKDGQFNPDARTVNNIGAADELASAVLFNSLAWALNGSSTYAANVATWIQTWFLDSETLMNPNLDYAQVIRGAQGQQGAHTGVLDLKSMTKLVTGVLILREGKAPEWTTEIDDGLNEWSKKYITWLKASPIAIEEKNMTNNHGSFYYNQLAAFQILVNDYDGAKASLQEYFEGIYQIQINANGDQPLESERTRPYHYRAYNLAAMITNAKLGSRIGYDAWNVKAAQGAGIQEALDYAISRPAGKEVAAELWPNVLSVGAHYGDPDLKYAKFLAAQEPAYVVDPTFLWNQPFSDSGLVKPRPANSTDTNTNTDVTQDGGSDDGAAATLRVESALGALVVGTLVLLLA